ncbi:MAG: hypothetical protein ACTHZW_07010 [Microbacteriaceae bacterium]|uniref:hypothetical protein n=1 Tax=Microbacterium sp. TaxID=51671 RepID=UPI003F95008A
MVDTFVSPTDEGSFTEMVRNITDGIEEARTDLESCSTTYDAKKDSISAWDKFVDWFTSNMNEVVEKLNAAIEKFNEFVLTIGDYLSPGNPFVMYAKRDDWLQVKRDVTSSKTTITSEYLKADTTWKGSTGDGYGDLAGRQRIAIDTIAGYTDSMANFLSDYAKKILDSWIEFGARLITYLIDQIDAAAAFVTADPLEWLDIVPKIVTLCTNLAQLAVDLGEQLGKNFTESKDVADQLKQDMANLTGFPNGTWPTATI